MITKDGRRIVSLRSQSLLDLMRRMRSCWKGLNKRNLILAFVYDERRIMIFVLVDDWFESSTDLKNATKTNSLHSIRMENIHDGQGSLFYMSSSSRARLHCRISTFLSQFELIVDG